MSSSSLEMRSVGMVSGLVILLELRAGFPLGIDVKNDAVGVLNGKAAISPRMIFEWHDGTQTRSCERLKLSVDIGNAEVVSQSSGITNRLVGLRHHELKRCSLAEFEVDVPAAVESDSCAKVFDVEITRLFDLCCGDAGG